MSEISIRQQWRTEGGMRAELPAQQRPPIVSIIVVAFQDREEVAALIDNVAAFRGNDLELVIVDGGSEDGTLELLQTSNEKVDYWICEQDSGIYDAMNKGVAAARGEYILHLNAGDRLLLLPLPELQVCMQDKIDVACFRVLLDDGSVHTPGNQGRMLISNAWHHQGTFYRRGAHLGYDPEYKVFGDFDHNQRMAKTTTSIRILPTVISSHGNPGLSSGKKHFREVFKCIRRNSGVFYLLPAYLRFKVDGVRRRISALRTRTEASVTRRFHRP